MDKNKIVPIIIFSLCLTNCSLDNKSGVWSGSDKENKQITDLERKNLNIKKIKIFESGEEFEIETNSSKKTILSKPINNSSWPMQGFNTKNYYGNLFYKGNLVNISKKKYGKNKFSYHKILVSPIISNDQILISDDRGNIYYINNKGKIIWKENFYDRRYKKLFKQLSYIFYKDKIYISDNVGFLYSLDRETGQLLWKKFYGFAFNSKLKIFDNKLYLVDKTNRIICFNISNGKKIWETETINTFIKSQGHLAIAISDKGHIFFINSAGDLFKIDSETGKILWSLPTISGLDAHDTDFFESSDIVIEGQNLFFSNKTSNVYSVNSETGFVNWKKKITTNIKPIINGNNIFVLTENGFLINLDKKSSNIMWSSNVFKNIKKNKKISMKASGFILANDLIYITTSNGNLIICFARTGKKKYVKRIAKSFNTGPIVSNRKLYLLANDTKLFIFN